LFLQRMWFVSSDSSWFLPRIWYWSTARICFLQIPVLANIQNLAYARNWWLI
jgi:hypothetical protein